MKLFEIKTPADVKNGQTIVVTKDDGPSFMNVPKAGKSLYTHIFKKDDTLRIVAAGPKWITIASLNGGEGVYHWSRGNKVTNFDLKSYEWKAEASSFNSSWYRIVEEDAPPDVITNLEQAKDWISKNGTSTRLTDNGDGTFNAAYLQLTMKVDDQIRVNFKNVEQLVILKQLKDYNNLPETAGTARIKLGRLSTLKDIKFPKGITTLTLENGAYTDLSSFPIFPNVTKLSIHDAAKLSTLKGLLKKFPKLEDLVLYDIKALKSGLLEIPRLQKFNPMFSVGYGSSETRELEAAIKIVKQELGKGSSGVVKAQRALLDADLEDYE